jgi:dTDP-4-amino-4,6-dideoxygalactose transaminase
LKSLKKGRAISLARYKIPLSNIDIGPSEIRAVVKVLRSQWLSLGDVTGQFERDFSRTMRVKESIAVVNGTAALHLANLALGVGPGDEVILPSLTFVATANAVLYCGATPVFADIKSADDLNISPEEIEKKITPRTKAICVVHYGGYPADMDQIMEIAARHRLFVIEDAAHAIGAELNGKKIGTIGDVGCYSFFSNKNLVTGEGGMVVTRDSDLASKIRLLRSHGMTSLSWDRYRGHAASYDVTQLGFNYRITEIASSIGRVGLKKLKGNNLKRAKLTQIYRSALKNVDELSVPFSVHRGNPSFHIFPVLLKSRIQRERIKAGLQEKGIQTSLHYPPVHLFSHYRKAMDGIPVRLSLTEDISQRELTLPLYPKMSAKQVLFVCNQIRSMVKG